jgi:hypothetical protein
VKSGFSRVPTGFKFVSGGALTALSLLGFVFATTDACVPAGNAPPYDGGAASPTASSMFKPSTNIMTAPFEDTFDRPDAAEEATPAASASASASASAGAGDAG